MSTTHQTESGIFNVVVNLSPDPPPPPGDVLNFLPNDNTLPLSSAPGANYVFVMPDDCLLTRCCLHGDSRTIGSFNTLGPGGVPMDLDFDLYVDGVFLQTLFTLPAGETDVDFFVNPNQPIPAGAEVQFVVPAPGNVSGALLNFVFSFSTGPT